MSNGTYVNLPDGIALVSFLSPTEYTKARRRRVIVRMLTMLQPSASRELQAARAWYCDRLRAKAPR